MNRRVIEFRGVRVLVYGRIFLLPTTELVFWDRRYKHDIRLKQWGKLAQEQCKALLGIGKSRLKASFLGIKVKIKEKNGEKS